MKRAREYRLLGTLEVLLDGTDVPVTAAKQRILLTALLLRANSTVSVEDLLRYLWNRRPPSSGRAALHNYVMRLRRALRDDTGPDQVLRTVPEGYQLIVDPGELDLSRVTDLLRLADAAGDDHGARAAELLREALAQWRGTPLADVASETLQEEFLPAIEERWRGIMERRVDTELRLGRHHQLISELRDLTARYPLRERFWAQLMLALHRSARQAEALDAYRSISSGLMRELGVGPGVELRELHQAILADDPALAAPADHIRVHPVPPEVSAARLVAAPQGFTGRARELVRLDTRLDPTAPSRQAAPIALICGAGGVGKTSLALHWANTRAGSFPHGQLYVNLRGFDPATPPVAAHEAIRGFLETLGVPPERIPVESDAQEGLYRSLLADRRMVVILDNARDIDQVTPLLPGDTGCVVVVTSRRMLTDLVVGYGAELLDLAVLDDAESRELLAGQLDADRLAAQPAAVAQLIASCAGLPLALSIVSAMANRRSNTPLAAIAADLGETSTRLDKLTVEETTTNLRAVFTCSYQALSSAAARLFDLLGLVPGADIDRMAAASLAGVSTAACATSLDELEAAHLAAQHQPRRYRMHELIRLFAAERAATLTERERTAALRGLVEFYLRTAYRGERLLDPHRPPIDPGEVDPDTVPSRLPDRASALAWFSTEHDNLLAVQQLTVERNWSEQCWRLAWTLGTFHWRQGHVRANLAAWQAAVEATERLGDTRASAQAWRRLGLAWARSGDQGLARKYLRRALDLSERDGDVFGQAHTLQTLAWVEGRFGRDQQAVVAAEESLRLLQHVDHPVWRAQALNLVGWYSARIGRYRQAANYCTAAVVLAGANADQEGEANALDSLGYVARHLGWISQAISHYRRAIALFEQLGSSYQKATTLENLGECHHALGQVAEARQAWQQALRHYRDQHRAVEADRVESELAALAARETGPAELLVAVGPAATTFI